MKVLLLQPPVQDFYDTDIRLQPIGLAYLKAALQKHLPKVRVVIKTYHHSRKRQTIRLPQALSYLKEFYAKDDKSPFSSFHHFYHFGTDFETIAKEVADEKPDLVGISALFAPYYREALACADAIKKKWNAPILLGGSQVSAMPEFMLAHPSVDFIIRGEGEKPLVEFLRLWRRGTGRFSRASSPAKSGVPVPFRKAACPLVPNLGFKKNGKIILNPRKENFSIEALPFPDLSDFRKEDYLFEKKPLCFMVTSRGCPYQCAFCSVHKTFGHIYRRRTNDHILAEMELHYREGYRVFDFEDDNFAFDKKKTLDLCKKISETFPKKDIQLLAMNGICYWTLDRETLDAMRCAGFTHLNLSLVSTDAALLKTVHRPHGLKKYKEVVGEAIRLGFKIVSYQILGLPGDSIGSMIQTLVFNAKLPVLLGASPFYLIPNCPMAQRFDEPLESDILKARLTAMAIETPKFRREDLYTLFITTRILNFLKGIPLAKSRLSLKNALKIAGRQDKRSAAGAEILRRLLVEKKFYAHTSKGPELLPRFKTELFFKVWHKLDRIQTQQDKTILLKGVL